MAKKLEKEADKVAAMQVRLAKKAHARKQKWGTPALVRLLHYCQYKAKTARSKKDRQEWDNRANDLEEIMHAP